jgi:hypothetical protein
MPKPDPAKPEAPRPEPDPLDEVDPVDEADLESFPASDPPAWAGQPRPLSHPPPEET